MSEAQEANLTEGRFTQALIRRSVGRFVPLEWLLGSLALFLLPCVAVLRTPARFGEAASARVQSRCHQRS